MWKYLAIFFLLLAFLMPAQSQAQGVRDYGNRADAFFGGVYLGLKYGRYELFDDDLNDGDEADARNVGVVFGRGINEVLGWEFEYSYTATAEDDWLDAGLDVEAETVGFYLTATTDGDVYVKGRVGYVRVEQDITIFDPYNAYGIAYGVGAGFEIAEGTSIELEYTVMPTEERSFDVLIGGAPATLDFDIESNFLTVNLVWTFE